MKKCSAKRIFIISAVVIFAVAATVCILLKVRHDSSVAISYYYEQVCGSCNSENEFIELFNDKTSGVSDDKAYKLSCFNIFTDGDAKYNSECDRLNIPPEQRDLPLFIIGDTYALGTDAINSSVRSMFCDAFGIKDDTKTLWYYYRPECPDCVKAAPVLEAALKAYPQLSVIKIDTTDSIPKQEFKDNLAKWGVANEEWQVPFLYNGVEYLSGDAEIIEKIDEFLEKSAQ